MDEIIFQVASTVGGYFVRLRRQTWLNHERRRPEIVGQVDNVAECITAPHVVVRSEDGCDHYYRLGHGSGKTANCYLHVLVRDKGDEHVVASVWFTPELEEGGTIWLRMP